MDMKKIVGKAIKEIFLVYGIVIIVLALFSVTVGDMLKDYCSVFRLGRQGLSVSAMLQFLCIIVIGTMNRYIFLTDCLIKQMALWLRNLCMMLVIMLCTISFAVYFEWFPVGMWWAWLGFLICFSIGCAACTGFSIRNEKIENKKMADALRKIKEEQGIV